MHSERREHSILRNSAGAARMAWLLLASAIALGGCGGGGSETAASVPSGPVNTPTTPAPPVPPAARREWLAAEDLLAANEGPASPAASATSPVENRFYMPVASAAAPASAGSSASPGPQASSDAGGSEGIGPARHEFRGWLSVAEQPMSGTTVDSNYGQNGLLQFPGFSARFITVDGHLVPVERGILPRPGARSHWRVILSPGRVWSEAGDGDWSRASFPFVLVSDDTNEAHNGLATFVYGATRISALQFQVVQETASWDRNDFWGRVRAVYAPGPVEGEIAVRGDFLAELTALTPIRPWSQLAGNSAEQRWQEFVRGLDSDDLSAAGIVVDGVVYQGACATRLGDYPYCDFMRHGAFSLTKSMGAALTLLRLAQKYGDGVFDLYIRDYVDVTAAHDGWRDVRFIDVIDMATGVGDGNPNPNAIDPFTDENAVTLGAWSSVDSEGEKLEAVFEQGDYRWGPGQVFRYNTTQTFVLAVAMQNLLASRAGPDARLWDMMTREVLQPIGIRHAPMMHTADGSEPGGVPLMGIGLYPTVDDVAKIATLIHNRGRHDGVQLLSERGLDDALFRTGRGLRTGERNSAGVQLYSMSFWSLPHRSAGRCVRQIPYMEGYGGNFVALLPNGVTAFRFADADNYDVEALVEVAEQLRPWC